MRCRHRPERSLVWRTGGGDIPAWFDCASWEVADANICDCGHWLSLGPANDDSDEVQLEIAAVEHWLDQAPYYEMTAFDCICSGCQRRHLANVIATHSTGGDDV